MTWADDIIRILTVFWHQNASLLFVGKCWQIMKVCTYIFPQNPEQFAVWEEKINAVAVLLSRMCYF